jgi:hypothetical protein
MADPCDKHEIIGCTFCSGKFTCLEPLDLKPAKKSAGRKVKAAKADRAMSIIDLVVEGKMCGTCLTLYAPIGCECSRRAHFERMTGDSIWWLQEHHLDLDTGRVSSHPELIAAGLAFTSYGRAARRAGIPDAPVMEDGVEVDDSEQQHGRTAILRAFGVDPKWTPPRTVQASHLPV